MERSKRFLSGIKSFLSLCLDKFLDNLFEIIFVIGFIMLFKGLYTYIPWVAYATNGSILLVVSCIGMYFEERSD